MSEAPSRLELSCMLLIYYKSIDSTHNLAYLFDVPLERNLL